MLILTQSHTPSHQGHKDKIPGIPVCIRLSKTIAEDAQILFLANLRCFPNITLIYLNCFSKIPLIYSFTDTSGKTERNNWYTAALQSRP